MCCSCKAAAAVWEMEIRGEICPHLFFQSSFPGRRTLYRCHSPEWPWGGGGTWDVLQAEPDWELSIPWLCVLASA